MDKHKFPPFNLTRLLDTVFAPKPGERIAILIDLPDPKFIKDFAFLKDDTLGIQRRAHDVFYQGLKNGGLAALKLAGGDLFAYQITGGSNLDLPDAAVDPVGRRLSLEKDIYPNYDIILCISTFSATAPLTAFAKRFGFRGATLHGLNDIILRTGLAVDYNEVSRNGEKLRLGLTRADSFDIDFEVDGQTHTLKLLCNRQEAQKSHGLCRGEKPDIANLPAGEIYFVPEGAEGIFPMRYEDGTLGLMHVAGNGHWSGGWCRIAGWHGRRECDGIPPADRRAPGERERGVQAGGFVSACRSNSDDNLEDLPACGKQARYVTGTEETLPGQIDLFHTGPPAFHLKPGLS